MSCSPSHYRSRRGASVPELALILTLIACAVGSIWYWQGSALVRQTQMTGAASENARSAALLSVAITPDQQQIFTTGLCGTLRTHSLATRELLNEIQLEYGYSQSLFCSPTGQQLVVGMVTGHVQIWDFDSKESKPRTIRGHQSDILCGAFHPVGDFFVTCDKAGNCIAWSSHTLTPVWTIPNGTGAVSTLCFSSDGRRMITGDLQGFLKVWDAMTGKLQSSHHVDNSEAAPLRKIVAVQSIPNSEEVIVVAVTGPIQLWDLKLGQCKRHFEIHSSCSRCLALSSDGSTLLSGAVDGSISVWDIRSAARLKKWSAHASGVLSLAVTADGKNFVSVGWDGQMHVWPL